MTPVRTSYSGGKITAGAETMESVSVSAKGQLVIPKALRQRVGLQDGGRVTVSVDDGHIILEPVPAESAGWRKWRGALKGERALAELAAEHRAEVEADAKGS